ncbi:hypothetical protein HK102_003291 [Quaeritorhiza haematococci]|nr:hypothetical protein HK102_003291 [Quaeritorhiza haematococci]
MATKFTASNSAGGPSGKSGVFGSKDKDHTTFHTIRRHYEAINPSTFHPHYPKLAAVSAPHVESFNSIFSYGSLGRGLLDQAVDDIGKKVIFDTKPGERVDPKTSNRLEVWVSQVSVGKPTIETARGAVSTLLYPAECRERGISYKARMQAKLCWRVNEGPVQSEVRQLGFLPILVRSNRCNLEGKSPKDLIKHKEAPEEFGGYFIVNGIERLIRLLIAPRRNHPMAIIRPSFAKRGPTYSHFGVQIRAVRPDQTSQTNTLHYCTDGNLVLRFSYRKQEYMVPVMLVLRALRETTDREVFEYITSSTSAKDTFLTDRVELLLRSFRKYPCKTQKQCLTYIGSKFHIMLDSPEDSTEEEVGMEFLRKVVLVHLEEDRDKFNLLIFMIQKLYALVAGDCAPDNPDSPQHQEIYLGGHLIVGILKEKLGEWITNIKVQIVGDLRRSAASVDFKDRKYLARVFQKCQYDIGKKIEYFLATGNLNSPTGLDMQQVAGYTIVAEKLNFFRYIAHFRSIHRGAFFAELKTTAVRKLLPDAWGFLCPVHTPDGAPCGLLNHLSHTCRIVTKPVDVGRVPGIVASLGVGQMVAPLSAPSIAASVEYESSIPRSVSRNSDDMDEDSDDEDAMDEGEDDEEEGSGRGNAKKKEDLKTIKKMQEQTIVSVQLDGKMIGWCTAKVAEQVAKTLRYMKIKGEKGIPLELEIGHVPPSIGGQYPGLFLFSTPTRMMRTVKYLPTSQPDMIGSFEQVYMDIACLKEDIVPGITTHIEYKPTDMLSIIANMTPFSDFNQSPRNMYQCQMGKQAMGTPAQNFPHRTDNKLYRLQTGQTPIVRPALHDEFGLDGYPNGMNAVVAVISYTGYDMEDASIINKSSHERGYGYGTVYKSEFIDLSDKKTAGEGASTCYFGLFPGGEAGLGMSGGRGDKKIERLLMYLDLDGLPQVGLKLTQGDPFYAYVDDTTGKLTVEKYKGLEEAYVDEVRLVGSDSGDEPLRKVHIKLRIPRPPVIGDKFSSRHGQKGVCSQKWPSIDMPFTESGIQPDVIINPHAFPSRMTIGMFVESLAGKAGALHGRAHDATPFTFSEQERAMDYFGEELKSAGFNYHGNEPMYSGITGKEFKADIYIGVVYYQRLRHMVSDKFQVRTTGPVHNLTQQPVKGRKRAGGIRFGEMERDSLLAHGVSFCLQDRLFNCSDYSHAYVCKLCGSLLSPYSVPSSTTTTTAGTTTTGMGIGSDARTSGTISTSAIVSMTKRQKVECRSCGTSKGIDVVAVPYVFRYLCAELAAMNVKLRLEV